MLHLQYLTPYRVALLILVKRFCAYAAPQSLLPLLLQTAVRCVLDETQIQKTCSEPSLSELIEKIKLVAAEAGVDIVEKFIKEFDTELRKRNNPYMLDKLLSELRVAHDEEDQSFPDSDTVVPYKDSVFGLFMRKCRLEHMRATTALTSTYLYDLQAAYNEYLSGYRGDAFLEWSRTHTMADKKKDVPGIPPSGGWMSVYNVKVFLLYHAEQLEREEACTIPPDQLIRLLMMFESELAHVAEIHTVYYLNYLRLGDYERSLYHFNKSVVGLSRRGGADCERFLRVERGFGAASYDLLNRGILEYKFGHLKNAKKYLVSLCQSQREYGEILQQSIHWAGLCPDTTINEDDSYCTDKYLLHIKALTKLRNSLHKSNSMNAVLELLYSGLIHYINHAVEDTDRSQALLSAAVWEQYGNRVLSRTYLDLAGRFPGRGSLNDIRTTAVMEVNMLKSEGALDKSAKILTELAQNNTSNRKQSLKRKVRGDASIKPLGERAMSPVSITTSTETNDIENSEEAETADDDKFTLVEKLILKNHLDEALDQLEHMKQETSQDLHHIQCKCSTYEAAIHQERHQLDYAMRALKSALKNARKSSIAKAYYWATIKLCDMIATSQKNRDLKRAKNTLERIFTEVLLTRCKALISEMNMVYAKSLIALNAFREFKMEQILEYLAEAERGFKVLGYHRKVLEIESCKERLVTATKKTTTTQHTKKELAELTKLIRDAITHANHDDLKIIPLLF